MIVPAVGRNIRYWRFAAAVFALTLATSPALCREMTGWVVGVLDGDTIDVLTSSNERARVRLAGIDAPEKQQPFSNAAKTRLSELVYRRQVVVEWAKRDRYGRIVGKVVVTGIDADLEMIKSGLAWHYVKYAREQSSDDRSLYASAEAAARSAQIGLWREKNPVAPWEFRRSRSLSSNGAP